MERRNEFSAGLSAMTDRVLGCLRQLRGTLFMFRQVKQWVVAKTAVAARCLQYFAVPLRRCD
jgi:hypothetical protein